MKKMIKEFELKMYFKDYREAPDWGKFDAIVITTPTSTYKAIAVDGTGAEKHIFCEKQWHSIWKRQIA